MSFYEKKPASFVITWLYYRPAAEYIMSVIMSVLDLVADGLQVIMVIITGHAP
jgi:hypothetical protein